MKLDLEQIKADHEAGTQGPFEKEYNNCDYGSGMWWDVGPMCLKVSYRISPEQDVTWQADIRRAERIPEVESALIEAVEALQTLWHSYKALADSGDAGFWTAEDTEEGELTLKALARFQCAQQTPP